MRLILHPSFSKIMRKVAAVMRPYNWCLIGGRAVEIWSNPPQTPDADILYDAQEVNGAELIDAFEGARNGIRLNEHFKEGDVIFLLDTKEDVEIDLIPTWDPVNISMIASAEKKTVGGVTMPVATAEDLIIMKAQILSDVHDGAHGRSPEKVERDKAAIQTLAQLKGLDRLYIVNVLKAEGWMQELRILQKLGVFKTPK